MAPLPWSPLSRPSTTNVHLNFDSSCECYYVLIYVFIFFLQYFLMSVNWCQVFCHKSFDILILPFVAAEIFSSMHRFNVAFPTLVWSIVSHVHQQTRNTYLTCLMFLSLKILRSRSDLLFFKKLDPFALAIYFWYMARNEFTWSAVVASCSAFDVISWNQLHFYPVPIFCTCLSLRQGLPAPFTWRTIIGRIQWTSFPSNGWFAYLSHEISLYLFISLPSSALLTWFNFRILC